MNIAVISDITFDLVLKQLNPDNRYTVKKYVYADPVVPELLKAGSQLEGVDLLIVHFDSYFFRYTDEYIAEILQAVKKIADGFPGKPRFSRLQLKLDRSDARTFHGDSP